MGADVSQPNADECKIGIEVNPKVVLGKPIIRGTNRYPARARSGADGGDAPGLVAGDALPRPDGK